MVFPEGTYSDIYGDRYETYQQAVDGHEAAKQKVINGEIKAENEAL
jgi:hypothetical protein